MHLSLTYEIEQYLHLCSSLPGIRQVLNKHFLNTDQLKPLYDLLKRTLNHHNVGENYVPSACFAKPCTLDFMLSYYDGQGFRVALFDEQKSAHIVTAYLLHYFEHGDTENLMTQETSY